MRDIVGEWIVYLTAWSIPIFAADPGEHADGDAELVSADDLGSGALEPAAAATRRLRQPPSDRVATAMLWTEST